MAEKTRGSAQDEITRSVFDHLVELAAFELDADEAEYLHGELNGQLKSIAELAAIDIPAGMEITSHGVPYPPPTRPALREDEALLCPDSEFILAQAPELEDRYIVVPDIPNEELS
ncbi:MAG: hypothetical protein JXA97_03925 [Anaerolineales bacterium]|nr:hypothetical protein [Anaerolineales bacterium]